ncbi:MAG TPA: response regulator transcription factor [Burkholderiales bacterium]|nr:response regulator transcription factor [Burkholderiales bacterium]
MKPIRVVLADDHNLVRSGLKSLLLGVPYVEVVAEATTGQEAVELARALDPDVVLMDISMKGLNGIEAAAIINREKPLVRVVMLSMHDTRDFVSQALKAGACGYLLKDAVPPELELALHAVMAGDTYLSPRVSRQVVQSYVRPTVVPDVLDTLSPRQREILRAIATGRAMKQIAQDLGLSIKTVESHRAQIMERLDIHDIAGLVRFSIRVGLINADD